MNPERVHTRAVCRPQWLAVLALSFAVLVAAAPAEAQRTEGPTKTKKAKKKSGGGEEKPVFDFTGMDLSGRLRTPQLLYFLDRASAELERASLERRSFVPEMVRSLDEEAL